MSTTSVPAPSRQVKVGTSEAVVDHEDFELVDRHTWYLCNGYARADVWKGGIRRRVYMHRLILPTKLHVDHRNGNKLDNRRANLRASTRSQNLQNRKGATSQSSTGKRGVYIDKRDGAIYARCVVEGRAINLGRFPTIDAADQAICVARSEYMTHSAECTGNAR